MSPTQQNPLHVDCLPGAVLGFIESWFPKPLRCGITSFKGLEYGVGWPSFPLRGSGRVRMKIWLWMSQSTGSCILEPVQAGPPSWEGRRMSSPGPWTLRPPARLPPQPSSLSHIQAKRSWAWLSLLCASNFLILKMTVLPDLWSFCEC